MWSISQFTRVIFVHIVVFDFIGVSSNLTYKHFVFHTYLL